MSESNMQKMQSASDYTPTTEEVRNADSGQPWTQTTQYVVERYADDWQGGTTPERVEQFDRWLAEVKAEAVIELVARIEAAVILLGDDDITPTGRRMISKVLNPYRQGEGSGNCASQSPVESSNLLNGEEQ